MRGDPMSIDLDSVNVEHSALDIGLGDVLRSALSNLWRRKWLVTAVIASSLALGIMAVFAIPPSYTPTAYIRGGFVVSNALAKDQDNKGGPYVGLDLTRVIETQSHLLQSEDLARRVVQQLGLEKLRPELVERHWLPIALFGRSAKIQDGLTNQDDTINRAAMTLLNRLSVTSDQLRTYMIKVSYTGNDPALAVAVTNAFVAEFIRSSKLQVLFQQRSAAEAALSDELDKFGDKHPRVMQAKSRLATLDEMLKGQLNEAPEVLLQDAGENVTKATAFTLTSSPKPSLLIGLLLLIGSVVGIVVALYVERKHWAETFSNYISPFA